MFRRTKIVATVGPASAPADMLDALIEAGVNVFRLNFSHGSADDHKAVARRIREAAENRQRHVAILADLQGPKIRIARFADGPVTLREGEPFTLDIQRDENSGDQHGVGISYPQLTRDCQTGDVLLLDDGLIELRVTAVSEHQVQCTVLTGGTLSNNKGINRKGGGLSAKALTDKDLQDIVTAAEMDVDFLALSFPRDAADVEDARRHYREAGGEGGVVAKIERAEAVADDATLDGIIQASDGVMVARGDLAVEIGDAELVGVQKHIIRRARALQRFVITATQMMESMIHSPQPTRAEVSDVANAVLDGTDAVMLSAETAVGDYPVATVTAMDRIIRGAERTYQERRSDTRLEQPVARIDETIALAAMFAANHMPGVKAIIAMTESGNTPRLMSRVRSGLPIFAFTPHPRTQRRVAILRGVQTVAFDSQALPNDSVNQRAVDILKDAGVVENGDHVLITKGDYVRAHGGTNALKIVSVGSHIR
ncbi:pyruvate kinase [Alcanivorax hongdengensis A-11-3]|uniref:Pyruvate kinase n=1 Tax=Alcanivorax hongdengensis A-11-3 TaxID=1177179 RepID=L0W9Z3_9GAMM|nr:pyruvate kinase [Alcanivorax hongdengensis]EKF73819.1 pyruvate kinase [Alcanivorax hongdengensis A-11-3]